MLIFNKLKKEKAMQPIKIKRRIKSTMIRIKELEEYKGKDIEIEIKIIEKEKEKTKENKKNLAGIFSKYAKNGTIQEENNIWEIVAKESKENIEELLNISQWDIQ